MIGSNKIEMLFILFAIKWGLQFWLCLKTVIIRCSEYEICTAKTD